MKHFHNSAKLTLILVYLVIIAGAMVRMTGSGMGCPDWPKCFGYYIPPTDVKQLTWSPGRSFEEGQVIIKDEQLLVAEDDFTTGTDFDASHWRPYTKHDYAIFNPQHTWIEYINRLFGALAGLGTLVMAFISLRFRKKYPSLTVLSWLTVFLMGFQGWLGATVVYSVLNPVKITIHMVMALVIVAIILYIIRKSKSIATERYVDRSFKLWMTIAMALTLIQIIIGTQVRQWVDNATNLSGDQVLATLMDSPEAGFYIHRSFSIIVSAVIVFLFYRNRKMNFGFAKMNWVLALLIIEILSGLSMAYFDFPFGSQAVHLVIGSVLFGVQFYLILEVFRVSSVIDKTYSKS